MAENTRKAVVSLAQVSTAFGEYAEIRGMIGQPVTGHSFDKGARGKGFAQYSEGDEIVRTFESKEDALTFYARYAEVAREVLEAVGFKSPESALKGSKTPEGTMGTQEGTNGPEHASPAVPTQQRRRVKAGTTQEK